MSRTALLSSAFSTPGKRAFGSRGTLDEGYMHGDIDWGGLNIAEGVMDRFEVELRAPCFVSASCVMKMGEKATGLFFVRAFVHEAGFEDIVVVLGDWCARGNWLTKFFKLPPARVRALLSRYGNDTEFVADWPASLALKFCESGALVERWGAPMSVGRIEDDVDRYTIAGVVHRSGVRHVVTELVGKY